VNCAAHIGRTAPDGTEIASSADFARYLLSSAGLAVVPGAAFEMDPYVRISYAASTEVLNEAVDRLDAACRALGGEA
jgi:aspartate aminotransferase